MNLSALFQCILSIPIIISLSSQAFASDGPRKAQTMRVDVSPVVDGDLNDPAWSKAVWTGDFIQQRPVSGAKPTFDTKFAVVYDDDNIYIAVRSFYRGAENLITRLTRRDRFGDYDSIMIILSPRADRLTGYEFTVNPSGVLADGAISSDSANMQVAWDAVWKAETSILENEWIAEISIPFDQLRFPGGIDEWGFQVTRWVSSLQERVNFNPVPLDKSGSVSAAGLLCGMKDIKPKRPVSIIPETYFSYKTSTSGYESAGKEGFYFGAGGYGKIGLGSDMVLDLAVTPDFGQVEVDEVVLNLTTYEMQFPEKRPFFLEGAGLFQTPIQLFYSRRIGAPPPYPTEVGKTEEVTSSPALTPILGAAKLTGRSANGLSVGIVEALLLPTQFTAIDQKTGEFSRYISGSPWTNAAVLRVNTEPGEHMTLGALGTALNPTGSGGSYTGGADLSLFDANREYVFLSQVVGAKRMEGIPGLEETSGAGVFTQFGREGGEHFRFSGEYEFFSKGFDPNDLGYLMRDDLHKYELSLILQKMEKWGPFVQAYVMAMPSGSFNTEGLNLGQEVMMYIYGKWLTDWVTEIGGFAQGNLLDDRETRGGPPLKIPAFGGGWGFWLTRAI